MASLQLINGRAVNKTNTIPLVICPYCKSTNTTKISAKEKIVNTTLFGLFGTKRHRQ